MNSNGYAPSLLDTEYGECYICHYECDTARHEIFYGTAARKLSKRYGLWVNLCPRCHRMIHKDKESKEAVKLIKAGKAAFLKAGHTEDDFIRIFGRGEIKSWEI